LRRPAGQGLLTITIYRVSGNSRYGFSTHESSMKTAMKISLDKNLTDIQFVFPIIAFSAKNMLRLEFYRGTFSSSCWSRYPETWRLIGNKFLDTVCISVSWLRTIKWNLWIRRPICHRVISMKMKAIRSSEQSVHTRSTRRHIPEDGMLQIVFRFRERRECYGSPTAHFLSLRWLDPKSIKYIAPKLRAVSKINVQVHISFNLLHLQSRPFEAR
jgi:hypothetical protein